jgi:integrase
MQISFGKQPYWPGTLYCRNVVPAIERAGITKPNLGWHTLRRSYASLLLSSGISLRVSMELMRHSTPEMTLGLYAQTVGDEKRDAGKVVAALVMGNTTQKQDHSGICSQIVPTPPILPFIIPRFLG